MLQDHASDVGIRIQTQHKPGLSANLSVSLNNSPTTPANASASNKKHICKSQIGFWFNCQKHKTTQDNQGKLGIN